MPPVTGKRIIPHGKIRRVCTFLEARGQVDGIPFVEHEVCVVNGNDSRAAEVPDPYAVALVVADVRERHLSALVVRVAGLVVNPRLVEGDVEAVAKVTADDGAVDDAHATTIGDVYTGVLVVQDVAGIDVDVP